MELPDVNVLINSFRSNVPRHVEYRGWLERLIAGPNAYAMSDLVLTSFLRIVTNPRVLGDPYSLEDAMAFVSTLRVQPNYVQVSPGPGHWSIFLDLCRQSNATGNLVPDAYLAALAIESGSELITDDRDFARFPGLRHRRPLD